MKAKHDKTRTGMTVGVWLIAAALLSAAETGTESRGLQEAETTGSVTYESAAGGGIRMVFEAKIVSQYVPPQYVAGMVAPDGGAPGGPFTGNYTGAGVTGLTFRIMSDGHLPSTALVFLQGGQSGRIWVNRSFSVSGVDGEWVTVQIPFVRREGWERGGTGLDAKWAADLADVGLIGIRISQGGTEAQSYTIDDFMLVDEDGMGEEAELSPLEQALKDRFGVTSAEEVSEEDQQADTDADGMTDLYEILAEYDLEFANSIFTADIVSVTDGGVTIRWACVDEWLYTVFRATQLTNDFVLLPGGAGVDLAAPGTGYMNFTDTTATGKGPYYYRIMKRR